MGSRKPKSEASSRNVQTFFCTILRNPISPSSSDLDSFVDYQYHEPPAIMATLWLNRRAR
ncbi:hypothetical protein SLEP1_g50685 [Rubroshorea leprosula]|uniref:Uncharacterized protein n=1 Tax=Rubroshorea leprosula TaxID=152421 RepID=A0AAV5M0T9_9ROSI|nr:hypothetical protein SLEP1_g50685 [Rubroshorea leprosula]